MTLNGRYALCCRKDASFGAHHKKINEDIPILSAAKNICQRLYSFRRCNIYANIRGGSPETGRHIFSDTFEMRPALSYSDMQSVVSFSVIPKCMTLNDLDWLFRVKFCFAPVWLTDTVQLRKIIAWKQIKIDTYSQRCKSLAGILVSGNIRFVRIFCRVLEKGDFKRHWVAR